MKVQQLHVWLSEEEKLCFAVAACLEYGSVSDWARDHLLWEAKKKLLDSNLSEDTRMRLHRFFTKEQLAKVATFLERKYQ